MLINFSVGNFLSFKDVQTLSMFSDSLKEMPNNLHTPYLYNADERLLKSIAIYGHNSHGKSNFIKAFQFFQNLIFTSFSKGQEVSKLELRPFKLNTGMIDKPVFFEITFLIKDVKYRYRLSATSTYIVQEELFYAQAGVRENYLFERKGQDIKISKLWNKDNNNKVESLIQFAQPHILFLSVLFSQESIQGITEIKRWLNNNLIISDDFMLELKKAQAIYSNSEYRNLILKFISAGDFGFTSIFDKLDKVNKSKPEFDKDFLSVYYSREIKDFELYTNHTVFDNEYKAVDKIEFELLKDESAGTIKYFVIVCLLSFAIKNSHLIWVDEIDSRFHPFLLEMLIQSFHNPDINPVNSQLIFTTHNTNLLDQKLRRDQMVIVEKNEWGESKMRRAHTAETPIRIGKSIEKEYRKGKLGGVSKKIKNNLGPTLFD